MTFWKTVGAVLVAQLIGAVIITLPTVVIMTLALPK